MNKGMKLAPVVAVGLIAALTMGRAVERSGGSGSVEPALTEAGDGALKTAVVEEPTAKLHSGRLPGADLDALLGGGDSGEIPVEQKLLSMVEEGASPGVDEPGSERPEESAEVRVEGVLEAVLAEADATGGGGGGPGGGGMLGSVDATLDDVTEQVADVTQRVASAEAAVNGPGRGYEYATLGYWGDGGGGGGLNGLSVEERLAIIEAQLQEVLARIDELERLIADGNGNSNGGGVVPIPAPTGLAAGLTLLPAVMWGRRRVR
jgi:hypothetical protein